MKILITALAASTLMVLASGCSLMPTDKHAPSSYRSSLDSEVIAAVETDAVRKGTQVYWVNPPKKPKE